MERLKKKKRVFIIAGIGVIKNGDLQTAKESISKASNAGADAFEYKNLKKYELCAGDHHDLVLYSKKCDIIPILRPFCKEDIGFLSSTGHGILKIPSEDLKILSTLRFIGKLNKKLILSTGKAAISEISDALNLLCEFGTDKKKISILYCATKQTVSFNEIDLNAIKIFQKEFDNDIGFSDPTAGIEASVAAVALGAVIIEKKFTLSKNTNGFHQESFLDPDEFEIFVDSIRNIEKAIGNGEKKPSPSEKKNINIVRKSITASRDISVGEMFSEDNITVKRPGNGISPMRWDSIIGKRAVRAFQKDDLIEV